MGRSIRVRAIRRRELDEDKLALAFLMLAKVIAEQNADDNETAESDAEAA